jgi:glucosamine 6-phosphate synthetase-like amidotransferase/phosphosugar isomerase protein
MRTLAAYPSITITGDENSEIVRRSANHMLIGCGPEFAGPKTAGYTSSVLILYLCALESALALGAVPQIRHDEIIAALARLAADARVNIARTEAWFARNQQELLTIQKYILTGRGFAGAAAVEGALKLLETIKIPAIGFEFEEYLHGPILMTDDALGGVFFISEDPEAKPRMVELARCHQRYSRFAYTITRDEAIQGDRVLHLQMSGNPFTEVFEFVLIPQLLAARVPGLLGIADGSEVYDTYTTACATKYNNGW